MGGYFKVEVEDLGRLLQDLGDSQENLRKALDAMKDTGPKSTGAEALDNACDEFHDSWDNVIRKIADGTQEIEDRLRQVKQGYESTEHALRDAFAKNVS